MLLSSRRVTRAAAADAAAAAVVVRGRDAVVVPVHVEDIVNMMNLLNINLMANPREANPSLLHICAICGTHPPDPSPASRCSITSRTN